MAGSTPILVTFGLPLRNERLLDRFIAREVPLGHYLTQQAFDHLYAPSPRQVHRVVSWLAASRLPLIYRSPDGTTLTTRAPARAVEAALQVRLRRYRLGAHNFFAPSSNPSVPRWLGIQTISGLDDFGHARFIGLKRFDAPDTGYVPKQFRAAYDEAGYGYDGTGQTIGITSYGETVPNSDFAGFARDTGEPKLSSCKSCNSADKIQWFLLDGKNNDNDISEQALDAEYVHGMAVHSHLKFWLGDDGSDAGLEDALAAAANDSSVHLVSSSWGYPKPPARFVRQTTNSFKHAVAVGTTFLFSTGDFGADSGCLNPSHHCAKAPYPADSPYVVAVGGTNLQMDKKFKTWQAETAWSTQFDGSGSGGGCAAMMKRPSWQRGVRAATCKGRAVPDVSADADPFSGAEVWFDGSAQVFGGTSLSAPIITGLVAVTDRYLELNHHRRIGFLDPVIYRLANSPNYNAYFHDVVCGSNRHLAGLGWDEVTGWGSIDWYAFTRGVAGDSVPAVPGRTSWSCRPGSGTPFDLNAVQCSRSFSCHAVGAFGTILNSPDGWSWAEPRNTSSAARLVGISCSGPQTCYSVAATGWLQATRNGGRSWVPRNIHAKNATAIACPGVKTCYVVAGSSILRTTNGATFQRLGNPSGKSLVGISCPKRNRCYAITAGGVVLRTTTGGSWSVEPGTGTPGWVMSSLACPSTDSCYAVGSTATATSPTAVVYATHDGSAWQSQTIGTAGPLTGISCASKRVCDAVGSAGDILRTTDGLIWVPAIPNSPVAGHSFTGISCPTVARCYAVGKSGALIQTDSAPGH